MSYDDTTNVEKKSKEKNEKIATQIKKRTESCI